MSGLPWISTAERLPKEGRFVLIWLAWADNPKPRIACLSNRRWWDEDGRCVAILGGSASHWMPITPPEGI